MLARGKNHQVIPACVVNIIQTNFPEPDEVYVGYKEGNDDVDETCDSEEERACVEHFHESQENIFVVLISFLFW